MAIPYNPSSFNSNKTILQAIEELKKYLQENPCYKIYMYNDNYVDGTYVYDKSGVDDPDSIEAYDVIFFANSYYSKVESVGDSTITVWPAINFTGAEGPQGPAGADGADGADGANGISITNVAIDASNHLICTLSNGTTIDAGLLPSPSANVVAIISGYGTFSADEYATLQNPDAIIVSLSGEIFKKQSTNLGIMTFIYTTYGPSGNTISITKLDVQSDRSYSTNSIYYAPDGTAVRSTGVAQGKVLTSDGNNRATWEDVASPEGTAVKSTGETSGKVLTADGSGGASWQTAGGGSPKYVHNIRWMKKNSNDNSYICVSFIWINSTATVYTSYNDFNTAFVNGSAVCGISGMYFDKTNSKIYIVNRMNKSSNAMNTSCIEYNATTAPTPQSFDQNSSSLFDSTPTFNDNVYQI